MKKFFYLALPFFSLLSFSQIGVGTTTPDLSSALHLESGSNKGLLLPRISTAQRNAADGILSPVGGIVIYDTTINCLLISLENGKWKNACSGDEEGTTLGITTSAGKFGIGITSSLDKNTILEVVSTSKGVLLPLATNDLVDVLGMMYYNTTDDTVRIYNGSLWVTLITN
jgi:hypothetical protein